MFRLVAVVRPGFRSLSVADKCQDSPLGFHCSGVRSEPTNLAGPHLKRQSQPPRNVCVPL